MASVVKQSDWMRQSSRRRQKEDVNAFPYIIFKIAADNYCKTMFTHHNWSEVLNQWLYWEWKFRRRPWKLCHGEKKKKPKRLQSRSVGISPLDSSFPIKIAFIVGVEEYLRIASTSLQISYTWCFFVIICSSMSTAYYYSIYYYCISSY